jgi:pimeloyl-ACP methyl ester carboxylesterase
MGVLSEKLTFRASAAICSPAAWTFRPGRFAPTRCSPIASRAERTSARRARSAVRSHGGIGVLRFDFTGLGSGDGDFANTRFSSNVDDLVAAARHLERVAERPRLLVGHSLGGAAVLAAAARLLAVAAVATIGAPFDAAHVRRLLADDLDTIKRDGEALTSIARRPFRIKRAFIDDLDQRYSEPAIAGLNRPLLIFQAPSTRRLRPQRAVIFELARHPKSSSHSTTPTICSRDPRTPPASHGCSRRGRRDTCDPAAYDARSGSAPTNTPLSAALPRGCARSSCPWSRRPTRRATGVDTSLPMLERVPALPAGWDIRHGDARRLPFHDGGFDVAVASYVLHVLPRAELPAALAELGRVLRPDGGS